MLRTLSSCITCVQHCGGVQYCGGYHDACERYLEYRGGHLEYWWETQNCGGNPDAHGGYHEYHGGTILCNLSTMGNIMMYVGDIMSTVGYSNNKRFSLMALKITFTVLNTPTVLKISPTVFKISPTCIMIPHGTAHTLYRVLYSIFSSIFRW